MKKRPFVEKRARALRDRDFHVLALGYYLWESPSAQTVRIPVGLYGKSCGIFLQHNPFAPIQKIGMTGLSLGAVYTLLCALYLPEIFCVAAVFEFDFVMNGCKNALLG